MDLSKTRLSDNMEIECMGLRASVAGPAGDAALACQAEVQDLRAAYAAMPQPKSALRVGDFNGFVREVVKEADKKSDSWALEVGSAFRAFISGGQSLVRDPKHFEERTQALNEAYAKEMQLFKDDPLKAMTITRKFNPFDIP